MKEKKSIFFKKFLSTIILVLVFSFSPISSYKSQAAWGEFVQEGFHFVLLNVMETIKGITISQLKIQASKSLNKQVSVLISGNSGGGGAAFITDWRDYLVSQPENQVRVYMNDYLSQMTAGKGTYSGYRAEGFSGGLNYLAQLSEDVKSGVGLNSFRVTYEGNPSQMFSSGKGFKDLSLYLSGVNNPWAFKAAYDGEYQRKLDEFKLAAQTRSIAYQGFKGTTGGGDIVTNPGSLVKETVANIQNIPNMALATASSVQEVISSVVSNMITASIQRGYEGIQNASSEKINVQAQLNSGINSTISKNGPGAKFNLNYRN